MRRRVVKSLREHDADELDSGVKKLRCPTIKRAQIRAGV